MNRTDRLYAIVEELRAVSPRPRSVTWLARRFEVSTRTLERDLDSLRQTGVPIYAENGRNGGYVLDSRHSLPPLGLTPAEALAVTVALSTIADSPFAGPVRTARRKLLATLPSAVRAAERQLAHQVAVIEPDGVRANANAAVVNEALLRGRVVRLRYRGRDGTGSERDVEPMGWLQARDTGRGWYLVAWCRSRCAVRGFRYDRIVEATLQPDAVTRRPHDLDAELVRVGARVLSHIDDQDS